VGVVPLGVCQLTGRRGLIGDSDGARQVAVTITRAGDKTVPLMWRYNLLAANAAEITMLGSSDRVTTDDPSVWHGRFAHLSHGTLCKIARHCTGIPRLPHQPQEPCIACVKAKMQQRAISSLPAAPPHVALRPLDALAIDLFGRLPASLSEKEQNTILDEIASQEPTSFAATASSTRPRPSPQAQARARDSPAVTSALALRRRCCSSTPAPRST
jgi:hypothetical protein